MDGHHFDELTRRFARGVSRREVMRTLAGGVAALGAVVGRRAVTAAPRPPAAVGCAGLPGPQKAACTQACRKCGGNFDHVCPQFGSVGPGVSPLPGRDRPRSFDIGQCVEVTTCPSGS